MQDLGDVGDPLDPMDDEDFTLDYSARPAPRPTAVFLLSALRRLLVAPNTASIPKVSLHILEYLDFEFVVGARLAGKKRTKGTYKQGEERWTFERADVLRQRWYWKQRQALFKAGLRLKATTGAHIAMLVVPDTLNVSRFSTSGSFETFIRAWTACLAGMRRRRRAFIPGSITEIWDRFNGESIDERVSEFESLASASAMFADEELIQRARERFDDDLAFAGAGDASADARSTRLGYEFRAFLEHYANGEGRL